MDLQYRVEREDARNLVILATLVDLPSKFFGQRRRQMVYSLLQLLRRARPARKRASEWILGLGHWISAMLFVKEEVAQRDGVWHVAERWYPFGWVEDHFEEC